MDWWQRRGQEDAARALRRAQHELKRKQEEAKRKVESRNRAERAVQMANMDESVVSHLLKQREEHQRYTQLVLFLGYGGYFTLWIQARGPMSLWMLGWTGTMLGISILAFIGWELVKAWVEGRSLERLVAGEVAIDEHNRIISRLNVYWPFAFGLSAVAGLAGGIPLLCWYIYITIRAAAAFPQVLPGN